MNNLSAGNITVTVGNLNVNGDLTTDIANVSGNLQVHGSITPLSPASAGILQTITASQITAVGTVTGFSSLDLTGEGESQTGALSVRSVTFANGSFTVDGNLTADTVNGAGSLKVEGPITPLSPETAESQRLSRWGNLPQPGM